MSERSTQCGNCGATVQGAPGAMKCPYCGMDVEIPGARAPAVEMAAETEEERRRARAHDRYEDTSGDDSPPTNDSSNVATVVGLLVGLGVVAAIVIGVASKGRSKTSSVEKKKSAVTTPSPAATRTAPTPSAIDSVKIASCRCAFGDGQSTPLITLTPLAAPKQDPSRPLALEIVSHSGFVTSSGSSTLALPLGTALTPPDGGDLPTHMGVACDTGVYALVVGNMATGWSSVNAKWKWNATLPATMVDGADAAAPPQPKGTDFVGYCTPIAVTNGSASIALAGGKHASLSLKDGKLR